MERRERSCYRSHDLAAATTNAKECYTFVMLMFYNFGLPGRIRNKHNAENCIYPNDHILSLSLFPGHYVYPPIDDR